MITRARFEAGQRIKLNERLGLIRLYEKDLAVIKFEDTGDVISCQPNELLSAYKNKELYFTAPANDDAWHPKLSQKQREKIARRKAYVVAMDRYKYPHQDESRLTVIDHVSNEIRDPKPPSKATISRWYKPWRKNNRNDFYLLPGKGGRNSATHPLMIELMNKAVKKGYLKLSKPTKISAYGLLEGLYNSSDLKELGIKLPSQSTFNRFIDDWDNLELIEKREGVTQARAHARSVNHKFKAKYVLQEVQADTAHFNIGLLSECRRYYIGKPTIYFIFDVFSRSVVGYAIEIRKGGETPSGAMHAFKHAMEVKPNAKEYPMYGIFEKITMDNGVGYRSEETQNYLKAAGCQFFEYCQTHAGWKKAFVERFIGVARSKLFQNMEGYLGKYDPKKFKTDPLKKHAKYTLAEFAEAFEHFVIQYHSTEQEALNCYSPLEVWENSAEDYPPVVPEHSEHLDMLIGEFNHGKLSQHTGIKIGKQNFNNDELQEIFHDNISKHSKDSSIDIEFYVDWSDASFIKVQHPNQDVLIEVPNKNDEVHGKSFAEILSMTKENEVNSPKVSDVITSLGPVLTPSAARSKIVAKLKKHGVDVPTVAMTGDVDFAQFLTPNTTTETINDDAEADAVESSFSGGMSIAEDIEVNDDY